VHDAVRHCCKCRGRGVGYREEGEGPFPSTGSVCGVGFELRSRGRSEGFVSVLSPLSSEAESGL
jgi:hypothetical protein